MPAEYKLITFMGKGLIEHVETGVYFEYDDDNPDYIEYLDWVEKGNEPDLDPVERSPLPENIFLEEVYGDS